MGLGWVVASNYLIVFVTKNVAKNVVDMRSLHNGSNQCF